MACTVPWSYDLGTYYEWELVGYVCVDRTRTRALGHPMYKCIGAHISHRRMPYDSSKVIVVLASVVPLLGHGAASASLAGHVFRACTLVATAIISQVFLK